MNLILKSTSSDFVLPDIGVIIKSGGGSDFSGIPELVRVLGQSSNLRARVIAGTVVVNNGSVDLAALAGQQYLNQMWLQAGSDIAVAMGQVEGTISDNQHGQKATGNLHAVVTQSVDGFMAYADKTKLDTIRAGARPAIMVSMGDSNGPGVATSSQTPVITRYAVFRGTNSWTPNLFEVVAWTSNANTGYCDVYDVTNGQLIATIAVAGTAIQRISTATLANLPANEATIAFRIYRGGASTTVTIGFAMIAAN